MPNDKPTALRRDGPAFIPNFLNKGPRTKDDDENITRVATEAMTSAAAPPPGGADSRIPPVAELPQPPSLVTAASEAVGRIGDVCAQDLETACDVIEHTAGEIAADGRELAALMRESSRAIMQSMEAFGAAAKQVALTVRQHREQLQAHAKPRG